MKIAIYPGSFDPITLGHLDIIHRAARISDKLIIAVLINSDKKPMFSLEERIELIKKATKGIENIEIETYGGLLADYAREKKATFIIRGLRAVTDFEFELQLAQTNKKLNPEAETVFLTTSVEYSYVCSKYVRDIARFGGDISAFVPGEIVDDIKRKCIEERNNQ
ncbi:MAG: pantetheine-phosphate adenylyltransferase [Lachnospiraceae bacterium]|nr:pantetheine-phosphate adenylyltransferase [Lachnospiraceae bacterium]